MPTHIHLLITPGEGGDLTRIMHWIKTHSAKRWNRIHGSTDHLWGARYFARPIKDPGDWTCSTTRLVVSQVCAKCSAFCCFLAVVVRKLKFPNNFIIFS
jgi:REP element-mobilizing transposase RayT